jgi:hypothetical protein
VQPELEGTDQSVTPWSVGVILMLVGSVCVAVAAVVAALSTPSCSILCSIDSPVAAALLVLGATSVVIAAIAGVVDVFSGRRSRGVIVVAWALIAVPIVGIVALMFL